jgi:hypothetical protein
VAASAELIAATERDAVAFAQLANLRAGRAGATHFQGLEPLETRTSRGGFGIDASAHNLPNGSRRSPLRNFCSAGSTMPAIVRRARFRRDCAPPRGQGAPTSMRYLLEDGLLEPQSTDQSLPVRLNRNMASYWNRVSSQAPLLLTLAGRTVAVVLPLGRLADPARRPETAHLVERAR